MSLADLLQLIQQQHLFLRAARPGRVALWSPNKRVPREARLAIKAHAPTLCELLDSHDINVCPAPDLHRQAWRYAGNGRYACNVCERIGV